MSRSEAGRRLGGAHARSAAAAMRTHPRIARRTQVYSMAVWLCLARHGRMLLRMYTRWADKQPGYRVTVSERSEGEEAGLKSASISIDGSDAYGTHTARTPAATAPTLHALPQLRLPHCTHSRSICNARFSPTYAHCVSCRCVRVRHAALGARHASARAPLTLQCGQQAPDELCRC
jgi:hypothetical protein